MYVSICVRERLKRVSEYEDAPGFRLGPRVVTRTQARRDGLQPSNL
jgi:hypothetical protein